MFIYRLAGIQELFLLLYLASAARQALCYCIFVLHEAGGVQAMGRGPCRTRSAGLTRPQATGPRPARALPDP